MIINENNMMELKSAYDDLATALDRHGTQVSEAAIKRAIMRIEKVIQWLANEITIEELSEKRKGQPTI